MNVLVCNNIKKSYPMGDVRIDALRGVNLSIEKGSFTIVTGASGSGKSTLLHCIAGIDMPDSGKISIDGKDMNTLKPDDQAIVRRRNIGIVYQFFNLILILTVRQNILLPLSLDKKKPDMEYFNEIVDALNIKDRLEHYPSQLSGGQQQRCAIARAIIAKPQICLADEPTGNLDRHNTDEVMSLFQTIQKRLSQTVVMVTHEIRLTEHVDRVLTMEDGIIVNDSKGGTAE